MKKRQIKKTIVRYQSPDQHLPSHSREPNREERSRSREKQQSKHSEQPPQVKVQEMNVNSRKARLEAMRRAQQQQQQDTSMQPQLPAAIQVKIEQPMMILYNTDPQPIVQNDKPKPTAPKLQSNHPKRQKSSSSQNSQSQQQQYKVQIIKKPVFIAKQYREANDNDEQILKQQQRRKRNAKYTTKMLLQQQKYQDSEQQNQNSDSQNDAKANAITDDDTVDQELQFQLWKIRQLNRIRRDRQERRKHQLQKAQIDRRRQMTNQAILLQNRALGSDSTDNSTETKYVFMQKYYHRGAFYQDSQDQVFKRDYNLPTPMEMQDKSMLPQILQKRIGNFGKKGQTKYTHLTAEDTSELNPLVRPDQSLLEYWKQKTAGYKGSYTKKI